MKRFSRIYVEITNICNLSCSFCVGNVRISRVMNDFEFNHVLKQVKEFTDHIYLHVLGEPLLHPQLEAFLDMAKDADIKVNITTNGTLLREKQDILLRAPALRKISISLHSMESNNFQATAQYLQEVAVFVTAAAAKGIFCDLRLWNLGGEEEGNQGIFTLLCDVFALDEETKERAKAKLYEGGNATLASGIFLGTAQRFTWPSLDGALIEAPLFCHGLRSQLAILCDGTVVPCCLDSKGDISLGNIFQSPLTEILKSPQVQEFYDGFSARRPSEELCRRCEYAKRF